MPISMEREGRHLLVVAAEEVAGADLVERLRDRAANGHAEVRVVAPAITGSALKHAMGDVDAGIEAARERLATSCRRLERAGFEVSGTVGDADPLVAIEDELGAFPADEIVLVTRPDADARWLEDDLFERARERFQPEIVHVSVERDGEEDAHIADVERSGEGIEPPPGEEVSPPSRNFPRLSASDLGGILVAIVGTIVLVVLAAECEGAAVQRDASGGGPGSDGGCVARYIIAGGAALINIAHVVGLTLFESVHYRGGWERLFALLSLYGTPAAIVVSLLVH
jgi:hypothetical protein